MASTETQAEIAVIGGSGFSSFGERGKSLQLETPYGATSDAITLHQLDNRAVAFLPRHGPKHSIPPHNINSRANIWALHSIGVRRIVAISACGSLQPLIVPGSIVVCDQFVDRTKNRPDTFFDGPDVAHVSSADPYCDELRRLGTEACRKVGMTVHPQGTVVVIDGPRYSTRAESRWYASSGWDIVGMTQYPEVILARELGVCYTTIALVTDYDAGLPDQPQAKAVSHEEVLKVFAQNIELVRHGLDVMLKEIPSSRTCGCEAGAARAFT